MKFVALVNNKKLNVDVSRHDGLYQLTIGEKTFTVNAIQPGPFNFSLLIDGKSYEVGLEKISDQYSVHFYNESIFLELVEARKFKASELTRKAAQEGPLKVSAPMPGKVVKIAVTQNTHVSQGDALLIIEAMKMQNELKAPRAGLIKEIRTTEGALVSSQQVLIVLE
jgi:biotin carboxyl carrier protein